MSPAVSIRMILLVVYTLRNCATIIEKNEASKISCTYLQRKPEIKLVFTTRSWVSDLRSGIESSQHTLVCYNVIYSKEKSHFRVSAVLSFLPIFVARTFLSENRQILLKSYLFIMILLLTPPANWKLLNHTLRHFPAFLYSSQGSKVTKTVDSGIHGSKLLFPLLKNKQTRKIKLEKASS